MRKALWAGTVAGSAGLLALAFLGVLDWQFPAFRPEKPGGKGPGSEGPPGLWKVGVLGDSQKGLANFRNIAREVTQQHVELLLHTGDLVANNDTGHYRLAYAYLGEGLRGGSGGWPHVAPGNHDLKGGPERFQRWCGPLETSFTRREVAFVLLNNAFGRPPPDPRVVEERIRAAGPHQAVVLAMHQAPFDFQGAPKPDYASFLEWLEKSGVAYLVCGHEHGYLKKQVGRTTVIVNGVGGDYDTWQLDQRVYATVLEIDGARISDRSIVIDPVHEVWENVEHLAVGHLAESYRRHPFLNWGSTLVLAGGVGWGWIRLRRAPRIPPGA